MALQAPKDSDFELFVRRLWDVPQSTALVFNCQMGRGRTTTGMIIGCLVLLRRMGAFPGPKSGGGGGGASPPALAAAGAEAPPPVPAWFSAAPDSAAAAAARGGDRLRSGLWGVVRSLLRVLESGNLGKAILDEVIDAAAAMQNLREAIAQYRGRVLAEAKERRRATMMAVCLEYLERWGGLGRGRGGAPGAAALALTNKGHKPLWPLFVVVTVGREGQLARLHPMTTNSQSTCLAL
jgi:hypothetical protein